MVTSASAVSHPASARASAARRSACTHAPNAAGSFGGAPAPPNVEEPLMRACTSSTSARSCDPEVSPRPATPEPTPTLLPLGSPRGRECVSASGHTPQVAIAGRANARHPASGRTRSTNDRDSRAAQSWRAPRPCQPPAADATSASEGFRADRWIDLPAGAPRSTPASRSPRPPRYGWYAASSARGGHGWPLHRATPDDARAPAPAPAPPPARGVRSPR
jgi:hypothetical protein